MHITSLAIESLRVIKKARLRLQPGLNIFVGANGSGKSSLLESLYFLARGRPLRSRNTRPVISDGETFLRVVLESIDAESKKHRMGIEKSAKETKARLDGADITRISELTRALPVVLINPESTEWVSGSPDVRRQFYDYLVFHVEHSHLASLQRFSVLIRQRNAALARKQPKKVVQAWDAELVKAAEVINTNRLKHFDEFQTTMLRWWEKRWPDNPLALAFVQGYSDEEPLQDQLISQFEKDFQRGFTQQGPHRFDLKLTFQGVSAKDSMSRGQQRYAAVCGTVASSQVIAQHTKVKPIVLFDDISAELDDETQRIIIEGFVNLVDQVIVTGTQKTSFLPYQSLNPKMFHVEHGTFSEQDSATSLKG